MLHLPVAVSGCAIGAHDPAGTLSRPFEVGQTTVIHLKVKGLARRESEGHAEKSADHAAVGDAHHMLSFGGLHALKGPGDSLAQIEEGLSEWRTFHRKVLGPGVDLGPWDFVPKEPFPRTKVQLLKIVIDLDIRPDSRGEAVGELYAAGKRTGKHRVHLVWDKSQGAGYVGIGCFRQGNILLAVA